MGAGARRQKAVKKAKGKRVSGNPAKAAAERKAEAEKRAAAPGSAFGQPAAEIDYESAAAALDLPKGFSKFLN